ncbi:PP2C family protein-serine/threonine phosphatase [Sphingomonas kaistensis]|uniref:PP2C family protein-serine/threonine phosphatase n=1 Tax=Sphingomonas kaistensis TaxID=298708 RepID=UPI003CC8855D
MRRRNEDAWHTSFAPSRLDDSPATQLTQANRISHQAQATSGWAVVADGMGGHPAGDVASRTVVDFVGSSAPALMNKQEIERCISVADHILHSASSRDPNLRGMGSTVAGIIKHGSKALTFNLGDSRIYRFSSGALERLSSDHTDATGALTRYLGGFTPANQARLAPHMVEIMVAVGDKLLICTDGLTRGLTDTDIASFIQSERAADDLLEAALCKDGSDNITFVLLDFLSDQQA